MFYDTDATQQKVLGGLSLGESARTAKRAIAGFVDAKGLANLLLDWGDADGVEISPMKLQKLVFFLHADFLVKHGRALIKQEFEAWNHGPVIPSLYREFKSFKDKAIRARAQAFDPVQATNVTAECHLDDCDLKQVREFYDFYKKLSAFELSRRSHDFEGVWRQARSLFANGLNMDRRISNDMIFSLHRPIHN
jgi:uncharacterized phage-associated protein